MAQNKMSFPEIVRTYQQPLYWYIRRTVLVHEDTEDILQETFIKVFRYLWLLRRSDSLRTWLYKIATNEIKRYYKRHKESVSLENISDGEFVDAVSLKEADEVISSAFLQMSPLQREVFTLKYYDNLDYDQISRITGSSKNTLMVSYHEACKKIEKEIKDE